MAREYTVRTLPATPKSDINYASDLNEQQLAAVTAPPGPSLVIAGAGSGKTRTLTYRVAYILDNGIYASNILLLTFTNKAAREMLERVENLVPHDTKELWGGTFHSIGNRILRRHADELGFGNNFSIMDREDQKELIVSAIAEAKIDSKTIKFPKPEVVADIFSLAVNMEMEIPDLLDWKYPYFDHFADELFAVHEKYELKKVTTNSMDFDDLLVKTLQLLKENPDICKYYQKQFEWVLVDEYQDTNSIQSELIDLLAAPQNNIMVVGDDAQSIYSWRGADFRNILNFPERYENARSFVIETNYRSVPEILTLANAAIKPNKEQFEKNLAPARPDAEVLPALIPLQDTKMQAAFVAQRILELETEGIELHEIAVLYRAHYHSMEVQMEFTKRGIPFDITSGLRFFEQAHIKDVASFMKFACNRRDEIAFKRIVKMLPGIGAGTADKLWQAWLECPGSSDPKLAEFSEFMLKFKVPAKAQKNWEQFAYTMDELLDGKGGTEAPATMMPSIMEGVYDEYMRGKFPNYDVRRQDLRQLEKFSEGFTDIDEFLTQLSLLAGQDAVEAQKKKQDEDIVCLSSIHQAKGLEYKVVFVIWLADGMFPSKKVIESDDELGSGLEEERRLFYVAVTRAKDELYLMYPIIWHGAFNGDTLQRPSRFLEDLSPELTEEWKVGASAW
ncbi:MAG: ATP-dependent helicase [Verrucomicrobiales bacterium]|nr:ATP-dependent helicase [Verrucomicrobiales bacterium]